MLVCAVELKGREAILSLLNQDGGAFMVPDCRQRLFTVSPSDTTESIRSFQFAFAKLMEDYKVEEIVVIQREQKGKFMGSATSFKLEAAIQLLELPVTMMSTKEIKAQITRNPIQVDFDSLDLKKFQKPAFGAAYAYLNFCTYGDIEEI
ncbi:MAG: DUF3010 family protein [Pseudomonadales bacterium]|nr:DUF3010 family protein [Pseudomonadales bacterium]